MDVDFLSVDEILYIHQDQIDRYGGDASLRDAKALLSAAAMPQACRFTLKNDRHPREQGDQTAGQR